LCASVAPQGNTAKSNSVSFRAFQLVSARMYGRMFIKVHFGISDMSEAGSVAMVKKVRLALRVGKSRGSVPYSKGPTMICALNVPGSINQGMPFSWGLAGRPVDSVVAKGV